MTARERFEKWSMDVCSRVDPFELGVWLAAEKLFWPPRPTNLPAGWRVKGEEPVMVMPGEKHPTMLYDTFVMPEQLARPSDCDVPVFVWELERVEVQK